MSAIHAEIENLMKQTGQPGPGDDEPAPAL